MSTCSQDLIREAVDGIRGSIERYFISISNCKRKVSIVRLALQTNVKIDLRIFRRTRKPLTLSLWVHT